jgi:sugar/nucleoside kinase (ribokinase family)
MEKIDFLAIGHACYDLIEGTSRVGGSVVFSSRTAHVLGCKTAVLTSTASDYDMGAALPGIAVHRVPADKTTTFENTITRNGRQQTIHAVAKRLTAADVPVEWKRASIVHLAPIANEVDPNLIHTFSNSLVGLTPQGWLRRRDEAGRVSAREWPRAATVLPLAAAVILSEDDLLDERMLQQFIHWSRLLILTQASAGCTVFFGDDVRQIPGPSVKEVESTGAGDVFAAAFLIRLHQTAGNPWEAARYANELGAQSVTRAGVSAKLTQVEAYHSRSLRGNRGQDVLVK